MTHTNVPTALVIVDSVLEWGVYFFSEVDPHLSLKRSLHICTSVQTNKAALLNKWDGKNVCRFLSVISYGDFIILISLVLVRAIQK